MSGRSKRGLTRRRVLQQTAILGVTAGLPLTGLTFPKPAIAAGLTPLNFSMSWLPEGGTNYLYSGKPFWEKNGLDVPIVRGYGSVATAQAVATGKLDIAMCGLGPALLHIMKGLDLIALCIVGYDSTMGIAVRDGGPVKSPKDLEGRTLGVVPTSGEAPFIPAYLKLAQVDDVKIKRIALDMKVVEQALISGQVDAIGMYGITSIPVFMTQNFPPRIFLYSSVGLPFYMTSYITRPDFLQKNESICAGFTAGLVEAVKFWLLNPEEALQFHLKGAPEIAATSTGEEYARLGMGIGQTVMIADEAIKHSIGYGDLAVIDKQIQAIATYAIGPDAKPPKAADVFTNKYIGNVTLSASQWDQVKGYKVNQKMAAIMGKA